MPDREKITCELIREADSRLATNRESPENEGLQSLAFEQQEAVLDWVQQHCEPCSRVRWNSDSNLMSSICTKELKRDGFKKRVGNLAMKTALDLCGFEPSVSGVEIQHYRLKISKQRLDRKEWV